VIEIEGLFRDRCPTEYLFRAPASLLPHLSAPFGIGYQTVDGIRKIPGQLPVIG
jgi:hypothetical protein